MTTFDAIIKRSSLIKISAAAMLVSLSVLQNAYAVGTLANTDITNTATVNYQVGGVSQTPVNSTPTTFKVDRKVNLSVVNNGGTNITTSPGTNNVAAIFTVTNTGNGTDSFTFAAANQAGDQFDANNLRVYRDNGATANTFDAGDTLIAPGTPVSFNADEVIVFFVVSDMPLSATDTQTAIVRLTATTTSTQTVGADNPNAVDVVFIDTGRDGAEAADNTYQIQAATLSVVKSAAIISDPVNLTGPDRKAIPGAVIEYTIVVTNNGTATATSVALSDNIPANTTYVPASMMLGPTALTDTSDADAGTFTGTAVNVTSASIAGSGGTATVKFRVTINN